MLILQRTILAIAIASSGLPAIASSPTAPIVNGRPTTIVQTHDLNLHNGRDVHRLKRRVADAVEAVCGSYFGIEEGERKEIALCRRDTMASLPPRIVALLATPHPAALSAVAMRSGPLSPTE